MNLRALPYVLRYTFTTEVSHLRLRASIRKLKEKYTSLAMNFS